MNTENYTPSKLLDFPEETIRIENKERAKPKQSLTDEDRDFYRWAWLRYDAQTNILYAKAREFRRLIEMDSRWRALLGSNQYVGSFVYAFYGYTPYRAPNCEVFAFDMNREHEITASIPEYLRKRQFKVYETKYGRGSPQILTAMSRWETRQLNKRKLDGRMDTSEPNPTEVQIAKLQDQIRALNARLAGKQARQKKPRTILPTLDTYIAEHKPYIRREITRRVIDDGVPRLETKHYDPAMHQLATVGRYEDITNLKGHRSLRLAIQTSALKQSVPDFKHDKRYLRSASVRVSTVKGESSVWCAVFNLETS
jgi:hypothetical protein